MATLKHKVLRISVFVLVPLIAGEVFLRLTGWFYTYSEQNTGNYLSPFRAPQSQIYSYSPDTSFIFSTEEFSYPYSINRDGMRDRNHPPADSPSAERRILLMGDSFVEGQGAPVDSTWFRLLEAELKRDSGWTQVRVMGAGVGGSDPWFAYVLLREQLLYLRPDLVLLSLNQSDYHDFLLRGGMERFRGGNLVRYERSFSGEGLYRFSHLYRFWVHQVRGLDRTFLSESEREVWLGRANSELMALFRNFQELGQRQGFTFVPVVYPIPGDLRAGRAFGGRYFFAETEALIDSLRKSNVRVMDLGDCVYQELGDAEQGDAFFWPIASHYKGKGYEVLARCTATFLKSGKF